MKKLKLSELNLGNTEVLSREELKKVLGGTRPMGSGSLNCINSCYKVDVNGNDRGTCESKIDPVFGIEMCECSVAGGSGCNPGGS